MLKATACRCFPPIGGKDPPQKDSPPTIQTTCLQTYINHKPKPHRPSKFPQQAATLLVSET